MSFEITVKVGDTAADSTAEVSGDEWHVISGTERASFGLTDEAIVAAFAAHGLDVQTVYACEPTPGNIYTTGGWQQGQEPPQTQAHLTAVAAKVGNFSSVPKIVAKKPFTNNSDVTGVFSGGVSDTVTNEATNSWSQANKITATASVGFNIGVVSGSASLSFEHDWGWGGSETKGEDVGDTDNVSVTLKPGQAVIAELEVAQGQLTVEITYVANLAGDVIGSHGGGWASLAANVVCAQTITIVQTLVVGMYTSDSVTLVDAKTKQVIEQ